VGFEIGLKKELHIYELNFRKHNPRAGTKHAIKNLKALIQIIENTSKMNNKKKLISTLITRCSYYVNYFETANTAPNFRRTLRNLVEIERINEIALKQKLMLFFDIYEQDKDHHKPSGKTKDAIKDIRSNLDQANLDIIARNYAQNTKIGPTFRKLLLCALEDKISSDDDTTSDSNVDTTSVDDSDEVSSSVVDEKPSNYDENDDIFDESTCSTYEGASSSIVDIDIPSNKTPSSEDENDDITDESTCSTYESASSSIVDIGLTSDKKPSSDDENDDITDESTCSTYEGASSSIVSISTPSDDKITSNVKVYVWESGSTGVNGDVGHVAIRTTIYKNGIKQSSKYMSFWPNPKTSGKGLLKGTASHEHSYEDDKRDEGGPPTHKVTFHTLDAKAIVDGWEKLKQSNWKAASCDKISCSKSGAKNCGSVSALLLVLGGIRKLDPHAFNNLPSTKEIKNMINSLPKPKRSTPKTKRSTPKPSLPTQNIVQSNLVINQVLSSQDKIQGMIKEVKQTLITRKVPSLNLGTLPKIALVNTGGFVIVNIWNVLNTTKIKKRVLPSNFMNNIQMAEEVERENNLSEIIEFKKDKRTNKKLLYKAISKKTGINLSKLLDIIRDDHIEINNILHSAAGTLSTTLGFFVFMDKHERNKLRNDLQILLTYANSELGEIRKLYFENNKVPKEKVKALYKKISLFYTEWDDLITNQGHLKLGERVGESSIRDVILRSAKKVIACKS